MRVRCSAGHEWRRRYLGASEAELTRRLADLVLGDELAARAYGPRASTLA